jgi:hypothetical protein
MPAMLMLLNAMAFLKSEWLSFISKRDADLVLIRIVRLAEASRGGV